MQFGTNYGGFYYPKDLPHLNENSVVYCFPMLFYHIN